MFSPCYFHAFVSIGTLDCKALAPHLLATGLSVNAHISTVSL